MQEQTSQWSEMRAWQEEAGDEMEPEAEMEAPLRAAWSGPTSEAEARRQQEQEEASPRSARAVETLLLGMLDQDLPGLVRLDSFAAAGFGAGQRGIVLAFANGLEVQLSVLVSQHPTDD